MEDFLTIEDFARIYKIHKVSVYRMIKAGRIKAFKVGREWRILKDWRILDENQHE